MIRTFACKQIQKVSLVNFFEGKINLLGDLKISPRWLLNVGSIVEP